MIKNAMQKIRRVCRRLGIELVRGKSTDPDLLWNGRVLYTIRMELGSHTPDIQDIVHEIAHWQIAAPSRRRYADFGATRIVSDDIEEDRARLLGIAWEVHLGRDFEAALRGSDLRNVYLESSLSSNPNSSLYIREDLRLAIIRGRMWDDLGGFLCVAMDLQNLGYLKNGRPTYHANPGRSWTRTSRRSSARSATSSQRSAGRASTRASHRAKNSARAG